MPLRIREADWSQYFHRKLTEDCRASTEQRTWLPMRSFAAAYFLGISFSSDEDKCAGLRNRSAAGGMRMKSMSSGSTPFARQRSRHWCNSRVIEDHRHD